MKILITEHHRNILINELFDRSSSLKVVSTNQEDYGKFYNVDDGVDIKGKILIQEMYDKELVGVHWFWSKGNKNTSPSAWKQMAAFSIVVLKEYIKNNKPKIIIITSKEPQITRIYNSQSFQLLIEKHFSDKFNVIIDSHNDMYLVTRDTESIKNEKALQFLQNISSEYVFDDEY